MAIAFESLDPFGDVGIGRYALQSKTVPGEREGTLFVNKDKDDVVKSGWALFNVEGKSYGPRIQFIRMESAADMNDREITDRLINVERRLRKLTTSVEKLLRAQNISDSESSSESEQSENS